MEPLFEVRGCRARTRSELLTPLVVLCLLSVVFLGPWMMLAVIPIGAFGLAVLRGFWRGRISLFADRVEIIGWKAAIGTDLILPLSTIRHIGVAGTSFRLIGERPGELPRAYALNILSPTAEDLFDTMVEALEHDEGMQCSVEDPEGLRCLREWTFAGLFPWQELTRTARLMVEPTGEVVIETDRAEPMQGTNFKALEIMAPGAGELEVRAALRYQHGRFLAGNGMVLGTASGKPHGMLQLDLSNDSRLVIRGSDLDCDGRVVGALRRTDDGFVLEASQPLPEPLAAMVLIVWMKLGKADRPLYSRHA